MNNLNFDNTLSTKQFAESNEAKKILADTYCGNEEQLYNIGQEVSGMGHGFERGEITHVYNENGYFYYVIEYTYNNGKNYGRKTLRTKDIKIMKKQFNMNSIIPKIGFKIQHSNMGIPAIGKFKNGRYNFDFDVKLETKGCNLQRPFCWTLQQKREFIITLLKGVNIPQIAVVVYVDENENYNTYKVIDGKQRIGSVLSFINNEFTIIVDNEEYYYNELPLDIQKSMSLWSPSAQIAYSYWDDKISDNDLIKWFNLLNFAGTEQEFEHKQKLQSLLKSNI